MATNTPSKTLAQSVLDEVFVAMLPPAAVGFVEKVVYAEE